MKDRHLVPEWMDDPKLDAMEHQRALNGLRRINFFSRTGHAIALQIAKYCKERQLSSARILDLGCGSGDVAYRVAKLLPPTGRWHIEGWDISSTAIDYARQLHTSTHALKSVTKKNSQVTLDFHQQDIFQASSQPFDFVYCSLFLHHFSESDAIRMLRRMRELTQRLLIVDDLNRSRLGYLLACVGVRVLSRSRVVHFDGPQSVRAAFSTTEALTLARAAGLTKVHLERRWPERWLLVAELSK